METVKSFKSFVFCGDHKASKSIYLDNVSTCSVGGLPINDASLKRMLEANRSKDIIFFSCGYPLMGCKEIEVIKKLQNVPVNIRTIPYHHKPQSRGFYKDDWWKRLSSNDIDILFENWSEILNYYYQEYEQMVLLPLVSHYFDIILNIPNKAMNIVGQFNRVVDLSPLDDIDEIHYNDKSGNLSEVGFAKIKPNIIKWLE